MNTPNRIRTGRPVLDLLATSLTLLTPPLYVAAQTPLHVDCHAAVVIERGELSPAEAGITLGALSRVSIRKTPRALFVRVLTGEVLLKAQDVVVRPVVITAGNMRISAVDAVVCVGVNYDQSVIAVVDGITRVATLSIDDRSHVLSEMTLRAGDRMEVSRKGSEVILRLENGSRGNPTQPCAGSIATVARDE